MEPLDLTTQSFGAWHVLGRGVTTREMPFWVCRCQCGTIAALHEGALLEGRAQSCGCLGGRAAGFCDLTGQRFGQWLVLEYADNDRRKDAYWQCRCSCGTTRVIPGYHLRSGDSQQCKSCAARTPMPQRWYGAIFVQGFAGVERKGRGTTYYCQCRCGVEMVVIGSDLRSGRVTSCGCRGKRVILHQTFGALYVIADAGVLHGYQRWQCVCLHCHGVSLVASRSLHPKRLGCNACSKQRNGSAYLYRIHADIQSWLLDGMSVVDIARRCQVPHGTIWSYIHRHLANPLDAVGAALQASGEELVMGKEEPSC